MSAGTQVSPAPKSRVQSVDALRGLIMIVMALDHVRDFFHRGAMSFQPDDLTRTTAALFFTRWITHFCAPVFMFTAGIGAFFWLGNNKVRTKSELSRFLITRGLWLAFLDVTVVRFAMVFSLTSSPIIVNVLWGLGWAMVALAVLVHLPVRILALLSIAVIVLHNLADGMTMWPGVHQVALIQAGKTIIIISYTLIPWFAVMASGFCFGNVIVMPPLQRRRWMMNIGLCLTVAFVVIRAINIYGDPVPWSHQFPGMTLLSFLRVTKYPPSLDFLLMTLGPALVLLAWLDRFTFKRVNPLIVFGRVPLFYFLAHLFIIHGLLIVVGWLRYGEVAFLLNVLPSIGGAAKLFPPDFGFDLWVVYAVWIAVVALLYPLCLWFGRVKERRTDWWLSYF